MIIRKANLFKQITLIDIMIFQLVLKLLDSEKICYFSMEKKGKALCLLVKLFILLQVYLDLGGYNVFFLLIEVNKLHIT